MAEACGIKKWSYAIKDDSRRTFAGLYPKALSKETCSHFFKSIVDNIEWQQPIGPLGPIPRKTAWLVSAGCQCTYCYGKVSVHATTYPQWMIDVMQVVMPLCGIPEASKWPNACNVNIYEDEKSQCGWHTDDEALFQGKFQDCLIVSLSLGETRSFEVDLNWPENDEQKFWRLPVENGDLMTMEGMFQKHYRHRIPKERRRCGPRINLTWRWIVQHTKACKAGSASMREAQRWRW